MTEIAAATVRPERVVGLHFFNPAPVLPLVEVVRAELSSDDAVDAAFAFAQRIGKEPIRCRDTPGFVVNRILIPALIDAVRVLEEGTASPEDIDAGMKLGTGWPIGPLALIDLIGVDVTVHAAEAMCARLPRPALRAARDARAACSRPGGSAASPAAASTPTMRRMTSSDRERGFCRRRHDGERERAERRRPRPDDRAAG